MKEESVALNARFNDLQVRSVGSLVIRIFETLHHTIDNGTIATKNNCNTNRDASKSLQI